MEQIESQLREQVVAGAERLSVDLDEAVAAGRDSRRVRALIALSPDEALRVAWARQVDFSETDRAGRAAWVRAPIEPVDEQIDAGLQGGDAAEMVDLLARCGVAWRHPALDDLLEREPTAEAAAGVVASGEPGLLRTAIQSTEVAEEAVARLRAASLAGAGELWDQFLIWRDRLAEIDELDESERQYWRRRLDGVGATLDPTLWARGRLAGDYVGEWFGRSEQVGDFLQVHGPTDWLEVVGWMELADAPSRDLAGTLAVAAAAGVGDEAPDADEAEQLVDLLAGVDEEDDDWEARASRLGFGFQIAIGEDEFGRLLARVAAHERLVTHGIHSPGVSGLPLSATDEQDLDAEAVAEVVDGLMARGEEDDEARVALVRTLCDARVWQRRETDVASIVEDLLDRTDDWEGDEIARLRQSLRAATDQSAFETLQTEFDESQDASRAAPIAAAPEHASEDVVDVLAERAAADESVAAMESGRLLAGLAGDDPFERLLDLWLESGPVARADYFRNLLLDHVEVEYDRRED